jgi:hypothetical protein
MTCTLADSTQSHPAQGLSRSRRRFLLNRVGEFPHQAHQLVDVVGVPCREDGAANLLACGVNEVRHGLSLRGDSRLAHAAIAGAFLPRHQGHSAERLPIAGAKAGAEGVPIRFVQIGSVSGVDITLPSAVLRSSAIELMGSGIGSVPLERLVKAVGGVLQAAVPGGFRIAANPVPLSDVEQAWPKDVGTRRTVFTMDQ